MGARPALLWLGALHSIQPETPRTALLASLFEVGALATIPVVGAYAVVFIGLEALGDALALDAALILILTAVVIAPLLEEPAKALVAMWRTASLAVGPGQGIILFTTLGLGFGAVNAALLTLSGGISAPSRPGGMWPRRPFSRPPC